MRARVDFVAFDPIDAPDDFRGVEVTVDGKPAFAVTRQSTLDQCVISFSFDGPFEFEMPIADLVDAINRAKELLDRD